MDWATQAIAYLLFPLYYVTQSGSQYYWPTYVSAAVFALIISMIVSRGFRMSFRRAKEIILPSKLLAHESSKLDAKMFFVGLYYMALQVLLVGGTTVLSVDGTVAFLNRFFGAAPAAVGPSWTVTGMTMLLVFLAVEFGYWFSHFLMHKIPFMWEFHKVHHSAEVLTPLTEWRQHPVELTQIGRASCRERVLNLV